MPVAPYGTALQDALRSGDVQQMKRVAVEAEKYLEESAEISRAAAKAERMLAERGVRRPARPAHRAPAAVVLYGVVIQDVMRSGETDKLPDLLAAAKERQLESEKVKKLLDELQKKLGQVS